MDDQQRKNELQRAVQSDIIEFFEEKVCDNMKRFIIGSTKVKKNCTSASYVVFMNNILTLSFIYAYGCLNYDVNETENPISVQATSQSSLRIKQSLQTAYTKNPLTPELVQFVLMDIQFEMSQGENSELYDLFKGMATFSPHDDFSFIKYFKLISKWRAGPARFNMDTLELSELFYDLLQNVTFLKTYDLIQEEDGSFAFQLKRMSRSKEYEYIPVNHLLYYNPEISMDMFSLFSMEQNEAEEFEKLNLRYICERNSQTLDFVVTEKNIESEGYIIDRAPEEVFSEIVIPYEEDDFSNAKKNTNLIPQVHAINYKYIKNLALAISDAIDVNIGSKTTLYKAFCREKDDIFGKLPADVDIEELKLNWDSIIVMLLIEFSPTKVLETLFFRFEKNFLDIARNLSKRIGSPEPFVCGRDKNDLRQKVDVIIKEKLIFGEASGFGKIPSYNTNRMKARAQAMLIISSLSAIHEEEVVEKAICAGNIYDNLALLDKMKLPPIAEHNCKYVCIMLSETFRHILCFYKGLIAYGKQKTEFDSKSNLMCLPESDIAKEQKKLHDQFIIAAKQEAEELKQYNAANFDDMIALMHRFIQLCDLCGSSANSSQPLRAALYSAIGKYDLLNTAEFKKYALGYTRSFSKIDDSNIDEWISFARAILEYLRNGTFELSNDNPSKAIYPYTGTCSSGNENYDGYKTITFSLNYDQDGDAKAETKEIKVLSEFSYGLGSVFYCLPNILRTSDKWWIDPVLINFKEFNEIFVD